MSKTAKPFRLFRCLAAGALLAFLPAAASAVPPPQTADSRPVLGDDPTPILQFQGGFATRRVAIAGTWSSWTGRHALAKSPSGLWEIDTRTLGARVGRHEYKFIVNGKWEPGANRILPIDLSGIIANPPPVLDRASVAAPDLVTVQFKRALRPDIEPTASFDPPVPVQSVTLGEEGDDARLTGYLLSQDAVTFHFDPAAYGLRIPTNTKVTVAGNFNGWDASGGWNGAWILKPARQKGTWESHAQLSGLRLPDGEKDLLFKFVLNDSRWLAPPVSAPNAVADAKVKGNRNLRLDPSRSGGTKLRIHLAEPLDLSQTYVLRLDGITPEPIGVQVQPGEALDLLSSQKPLGANLDKERGITTYRLFAPRATDVWLCLFDRPTAMEWTPKFRRFKPAEEYRMSRDSDGVWEISTRGLDTGRYYGFRLNGPAGDGETFDAANVFGDPYARAVAKTDGLSIVIDPDATNQWFSGWTDQEWVTPPQQDLLIYECHVRGMTADPSSGVPKPLRGKFAGLDSTIGTSAGIGHLEKLGVNAVELLPVSEYSESDTAYNWGYATVYFFAPESDYATDPVHGSSYYELKQLVNDLHARGFAVILDVVYNHVGGPNIFSQIDRKYYFRLNPDLTHSNNSGCGNDVRTEAPMFRRLIVDNILYYVREFHVDGFRFDLAELIDMPTMLAIRDAVRAEHPNVSLIAEPWSPGRGENKRLLRGTGWSAWNNDFRYAAKDFARGWHNRTWLVENIFGSVNTWALNPLQPVNYLESHDDMTLADELSATPNHDGRNPTPKEVDINRLAATVLFTSLGRVMLHEGQDFLRSKQGSHDSYNAGDAINLIDWASIAKSPRAETHAYYAGLAKLRMSPEGAAFRVERRPPEGYYRWILPEESERMLGYFVNVPAIHAGRGFLVLLNSDETARTFTVELPGDTRWRQIADGTTVNPRGLRPRNAPPTAGPATHAAGETLSVTIPPVSSAIFMNGF